MKDSFQCPPADDILELPDVTLCAVTSRAIGATLRAMTHSMARARYRDVILFTHEDMSGRMPTGARAVMIDELRSREAYSNFILRNLDTFITSSHVLLIQWDGFVTEAKAWQSEFLEYDYLGAPWPQFDAPRNVGNGGFSLRSKALLKLCADPEFTISHPEDVAIAHRNRSFLEERGIHFAPANVAHSFSYERTKPAGPTFGFHGAFHMPGLLGLEQFVQVYHEVRDILGLREMIDLIFVLRTCHTDTSRDISRDIRKIILRKYGRSIQNWGFLVRNSHVWL